MAARCLWQPEWQTCRIEVCVSADFTRDLAEVWAEKGKASMLYTAEKQ
jgi:hypothetical protein